MHSQLTNKYGALIQKRRRLRRCSGLLQAGRPICKCPLFNVNTTNWNNIEESIGITYRLMNKPDSSLYYLNEALQIDPENQVKKLVSAKRFFLKNIMTLH